MLTGGTGVLIPNGHVAPVGAGAAVELLLAGTSWEAGLQLGLPAFPFPLGPGGVLGVVRREVGSGQVTWLAGGSCGLGMLYMGCATDDGPCSVLGGQLGVEAGLTYRLGDHVRSFALLRVSYIHYLESARGALAPALMLGVRLH